MEGGERDGAARDGTGAPRPEGGSAQAAPGASYRRRRLLPRRAPAIAARPSVVGTGGAAEPRGRSHRTAPGGRGWGRVRGQLLPPPAPGSSSHHHPLPAPPRRPMAPRRPAARPPRAGAGSTRAHWPAPPPQRRLHCLEEPSLFPLSQWRGAGRGLRGEGGRREVGCGGAEGRLAVGGGRGRGGGSLQRRPWGGAKMAAPAACGGSPRWAARQGPGGTDPIRAVESRAELRGAPPLPTLAGTNLKLPATKFAHVEPVWVC